MNRIFFILLVFMLQPVFANPEPTMPPQPVPVEEIIQPEEESIQTKPSAGDIEKNSAQEPYDKSDLKREIIPETRGELFRVALMFLKVMLAVALSSVIIYFILLFVKKNYGDKLVQKPQNDEQTGDLKSPQSENDALKVFFNQTKNQ